MRKLALLVASLTSTGLTACAVDASDPPPEPTIGRLATANADPESAYTLFESGQVRPLALSPCGKILFAVNTPDNRLEVFKTVGGGLQHCGSVPVGLEPVAVAARSDQEAWVVNHVSDSVSIVSVNPALCSGPAATKFLRKESIGRVTRTLLVGDEPRDIVFAGNNAGRAFITTAHRGQNVPYDPQLTTEGVGRADVWVFNANSPGATLTGTPLNIVTLFTDSPRALAVSKDGKKVYAAGFHTGNKTTAIPEGIVAANGGLPAPLDDIHGEEQPSTGLIARFNGTHWLTADGRIWDSSVRFSLPDNDVFTIDAIANPPAQVGSFSGVGNILFNMVVNPQSGRVYVSNTDARNDVRFEGTGEHGGSTVRGHFAESRISVLDSSGVRTRHLNKHVNYATCCAAIPNAENGKSLAQPTGMAVTKNGNTLYVAGFGSNKVGIYDTAALENNTFTPSTQNQVALTGGGPTGLALDEDNKRLYVFTRFNNGISVVNTQTKQQVSSMTLPSPEPTSVVNGRKFLYDASLSSSHGDSSCGSCHIFGDLDSLAWDLGDPDGETIANPGPFTISPAQAGSTQTPDFRASKGPMTTQSLRGMDNMGPMHWRGDRTGGNDAPSAQPNSGSFDEDAAFKKFNPAFVGLLGRNQELNDEQMQAFTDFILQVNYPPNPVRNLDNSLTAAQAAGRAHYFSAAPTDTFFNCNGCHTLNVDGNAEFDVARPGFFGSDGRYSFENEPQVLKVPHLRNAYSKIGMFGMAETGLFLPEAIFTGQPNAFTGPQVRGFGYLHDGSVDTVFRFVSTVLFATRAPGTRGPTDPGNPGIPLSAEGQQTRSQLEQFILAFDSNQAPVVGQQVTLTSTNKNAVKDRIDLLEARALAGDCELIAKQLGRSFLYLDNGKFEADLSLLGDIPDAVLRLSANLPLSEITYTCAPKGSGIRMALDRDLDGFYDGDERFANSDPADASDTP